MKDEEHPKVIIEIIDNALNKRVVGKIEVLIDPHSSKEKSKEKERV